METVFVSEISYGKAGATFERLSANSGFEFVPVAEDEESGGVFILDPGSCGKNWSCVSTRAATTIKLPPSVLKAITLCVAAA